MGDDVYHCRRRRCEHEARRQGLPGSAELGERGLGWLRAVVLVTIQPTLERTRGPAFAGPLVLSINQEPAYGPRAEPPVPPPRRGRRRRFAAPAAGLVLCGCADDEPPPFRRSSFALARARSSAFRARICAIRSPIGTSNFAAGLAV